MLNLKITMGKDYSLCLEAENMNNLIDKIIEWQLWENQPLEFLEKKGILEQHKNSNWYYFKK